MGGPAAYTEQRGGYEHMLARHHDLAIIPEQRLAFVTLLSRAADVARAPVPHWGWGVAPPYQPDN
jgi:hemoglobin